jgi:hypothetical protein
MARVQHICPNILIIVITCILLSACFVDPEWVFRVSKGEIQFEKKASYPDNMQFDYKAILPNGVGEIYLYGFTTPPEKKDENYQLTLRIMVDWPKSDSLPVYYPYNAAVQLGGMSMAIKNIWKSKYKGQDIDGKRWVSQYFHIEFICSIDSLRKVAEFRGRADAQLIKIDLSGLIKTGNEYVSIDPIYARDSRQILALSGNKEN